MRGSLVALSLAWWGCHALAVSIEDFSRFAEYESAKISPDGVHLAVTIRNDVNETIAILRLADMKPIVNGSFGKNTDVWDFHWVTEKRLLVEPSRRFPWAMDYKAPTGELYGMNIDGGSVTLLFDAAADLIDVLKREPKKVLIQTLGYDLEGDFTVAYKMDVFDGSVHKVATSPIRNGTFVTDERSEIALVWGEDSREMLKIYARDADAKVRWRAVLEQDQEEGYVLPIEPSRGGGFIAFDNRSPDTQGIYRWQIDDTSQLIYSNPTVDVSNYETDSSHSVWLVAYQDHYPTYHYPDPAHPLVIAHQQLRATFPDDDVTFTSWTDDLHQVVAEVSSPRNAGEFLVFDTQAKRITHRLSARPWLTRDDLHDMQPIAFKARDGVEIRGYLTEPLHNAGQRVPMIVLPHGGPYWVEDLWEFNPEVQLLAASGYAVLQVNFRGSGGRGRRFLQSGYREWGGKMQDDVTDGVRWAIADGVADPERICIFGGSYGGYSALTGTFRDPDLYRCAIGYAGVYDLPLQFERGDIRSARAGVSYLTRVLGTDMDELRRRSPVYNAEKIKAKVLLVHGKQDERVPIEHAYRMRAALERAGNPTRLITETKEGHGFFSEKNRLDFYQQLLAFFAANMGPTNP